MLKYLRSLIGGGWFGVSEGFWSKVFCFVSTIGRTRYRKSNFCLILRHFSLDSIFVQNPSTFHVGVPRKECKNLCVIFTRQRVARAHVVHIFSHVHYYDFHASRKNNGINVNSVGQQFIMR